jgi:CheY-like chemotaxis protein
MAGKRILVVDDDAMVRESIEMMLGLDQHVLELVGSGAEALERYLPGKYDLVLTDNRMAGMTGLELAKLIKARDPAQRIILFSGSLPTVEEPACDLILLKPFSAADLRKAVASTAA